MKRYLLATLVVAATTAAALPPNVEQLETFRGVTQYRLKSNDMKIVLVPNHTAPVFTFYVVYHVGSRNEAPGNTGSAHLLEHMLFNKSTENFGKAKGHRTFQEVLHDAGADFGSSNMTTWYDRMNGYSTLPSDKLDLAMKIEADRLGRALILDTERQSEMSVVRNEYEIGENNPSQALFKAVVGTAIQAHPYHWDTIGYRSDIEGVSTDKLREHYRNFFWPDNSEAILVGDFDTEQALTTFDREFGSLPKSTKPIPQVITVEPPQEGERRVVVERPGAVGIVELGYIRPGDMHPDYIPLDVLTSILTDGVNSRLYRAIVESGLATDINAYNFELRDPFPLLIEATVATGKPHQDVENAIKAALAEIVAKGVTDDEVKAAQKRIEVAVTKSRDGTYPYASNLAEAVASADWKWFLSYVDNVKAVTTADVNRVATTYLVPKHATVGWFVPSTDAKPSLAPKTEAADAGRTSTSAVAERPRSATETPVAAKKSKQTPSTFAARTTRKVLSNGIILDVVENHAVPTVAIRGIVKAGDAFAPADKPGLPQLTALMLERGTKSRTKEQITRLLDDAGAVRSYTAGLTEVTVNASGLSRDLSMLLEVVSEELKSPAFAPDELAKAKKEMEANVLRGADNTLQRAMERLNQTVFPAGHPYHPAGRDRMLASVTALSADDLRDFHATRYNGSSTIIAIVGDIDTAKTLTVAEKLLGRIAKGQAVTLATTARTQPAEKGIRDVVTMPGKANMNIIFGTASGLRRTDPDYEAALIGNGALGQDSLSSRIGKRVRDTEGLSYNLYSRFGQTDEVDGIWYTNVNVAPQNLAKAIKSSREEIERFQTEGITDDELAAQKSFFAGNYNVQLGSNNGIAAALVTAEKYGYGPKYLDEFPARVRAVTREQVNAAMKAHFFPAKLNLIVAGDLEKLPE
jgi:zinc protease